MNEAPKSPPDAGPKAPPTPNVQPKPIRVSELPPDHLYDMLASGKITIEKYIEMLRTEPPSQADLAPGFLALTPEGRQFEQTFSAGVAALRKVKEESMGT